MALTNVTLKFNLRRYGDPRSSCDFQEKLNEDM